MSWNINNTYGLYNVHMYINLLLNVINITQGLFNFPLRWTNFYFCRYFLDKTWTFYMFMLQEINMSNLVKTEQCIQIQTYTFYFFFLITNRWKIYNFELR